jgi:hypothetical protein
LRNALNNIEHQIGQSTIQQAFHISSEDGQTYDQTANVSVDFAPASRAIRISATSSNGGAFYLDLTPEWAGALLFDLLNAIESSEGQPL